MNPQDKDWTKEQLMGGAMTEQAAVKGKPLKGKGVDADPMLWGIPGHLTSEEVAVFEEFRAIVDGKGPESDFWSTVYCFGEEEGEVWALCRWLRARKFVLSDVMTMVAEATATRSGAKTKNFYPDPVEALQIDQSLYFDQYPQLYSGVAKNGAPLFISKPGILNVDGLECLTTLDGILKFHWYVMMHDFSSRLREQKKLNPDFTRFECVCILDLAHLTTSKLTRKAMAIIKEQAAVDAVCFPETMCRMYIVNAPTFFSATWRLIKGWLDARTAAKIDVISSKSAMEKKLRDFVDPQQLPSDYGGQGPDTNDTLAMARSGESRRLDTHMLYLRGHDSVTTEVAGNEELEVTVYTRSTVGAKFTMTNAITKEVLDGSQNVEVKHVGNVDSEHDPSTAQVITTKRIHGPLSVKIKVDSNAGRFSTQHFFVCCTLFKM